MNPVYVRIVIYALAGTVASFGFGSFDAEAGTLTLNLQEVVGAAGAAITAAGLVFAKWGTK